jgi:hypothetical protein
MAPLSLIDLSGCWRKFSEIFGRFGICLARMLHGAVGGAFGDATNQELSEAFPPNLVTRHRNSMDCK